MMNADAATNIHPLALVEPGAKLGAGVQVGPFCRVGPYVELGDRTTLLSHVVVTGATSIGADCVVHPMAVLGGPPQSTGYKGDRTTLTIGDGCTIRESVTMNIGTVKGHGTTKVGSRCFLLAYAHVAHDCIVGDNVTMTNNATLGGHCEIGDNVIIGGLSALHQFVRVGHNAFIAGGAMVIGDIIPYAMASGNRAKLRGLNVVGMRRAGIGKDDIRKLRLAYKMIFDRASPVAENLARARQEFAGSAPAMKVIEFLSNRGKRPFTVPPLHGADADLGDDED
jgi:UDP-N-acetylglucosamine acyltransferase